MNMVELLIDWPNEQISMYAHANTNSFYQELHEEGLVLFSLSREYEGEFSCRFLGRMGHQDDKVNSFLATPPNEVLEILHRNSLATMQSFVQFILYFMYFAPKKNLCDSMNHTGLKSSILVIYYEVCLLKKLEFD